MADGIDWKFCGKFIIMHALALGGIPVYYFVGILGTRWVFIEAVIQFGIDLELAVACNSTKCNFVNHGPEIFTILCGFISLCMSLYLSFNTYAELNMLGRTFVRNLITLSYSFYYWFLKSRCDCLEYEFLTGDRGYLFYMVFAFFIGIGVSLGEYKVDHSIRKFILRYLNCKCMTMMLNFSLTKLLAKCCPCCHFAIDSDHDLVDVELVSYNVV